VLGFYGITDDTEIDWIVLNNIRDVDSKGAYFYNNPDYANNFIKGDSGRIMFFLVLNGQYTSVSDGTFKSTNHNIEGLKKKMGTGTCLQTSGSQEILVFDNRLILPYYIVKYERFTGQQVYNSGSTGVTRLDEEWKNIEIDAKADKFMNDVKEFYQATLISENKAKKEGTVKVEPLTPISAGIGSDISFELDDSENESGEEEIDEEDDVDIDEEDEDTN
jgi:hypothetical protein